MRAASRLLPPALLLRIGLRSCLRQPVALARAQDRPAEIAGQRRTELRHLRCSRAAAAAAGRTSSCSRSCRVLGGVSRPACRIERPDVSAEDGETADAGETGEHFSGETGDGRTLGTQPQLLGDASSAVMTVVAHMRRPPVAADDPDLLLVLAAEAELGGGEEPVDDVEVAVGAVVDELRLAV